MLLPLVCLHLIVSNACNNTIYTQFAVNTESSLASNAGKKILEKGGNAVDAAIAAALVIGVVNSFSAGIGGGGFLLIKKPGNILDSFDFREVSPYQIDPKMFIKNSKLSVTTGLSVAVPGEILGYFEAHKEYGKIPWRDLFQDAIEIAKKFKITKILEEKLKKNKKYIFEDQGLRSTYTIDNRLLKEGEYVHRTNLSETLEKLSKNPLSFYKGEIADKIINFINKKGGIFTKKDLNEYKVKKRSVLKETFYDYQVFTTNIPTSGLFIIEALKILERINIRDLFVMGNNENSYYLYHILIEVFKAIASERGKFGDPEFITNWKKLVSVIISDLKAKAFFRSFDLEHVTPSSKYKTAPFYKEDHGTTHLNVVDKDGMAVSLTSTINLEFGSKLLDPETGIIFNNQIDDFYIPGVDNTYGLVEMQSNILEGGKRPFSSAAPTILERQDDMLIIGATGGTRIPTAIITTIMYLLAGNSLEKAVSLCRIHNQLFPTLTQIEPTLPDEITKKLKEMGHEIEFSDLNTTFTSVQAIYIRKEEDGTMKIEAMSDSRKHGKSAGE